MLMGVISPKPLCNTILGHTLTVAKVMCFSQIYDYVDTVLVGKASNQLAAIDDLSLAIWQA